METKKQLRSKLEKARAERDFEVENRISNRETYVQSEAGYQGRIRDLGNDLSAANAEVEELAAKLDEANESRVNAMRHHQSERFRRIEAEKEADMLRGVVDYFIARHRLDYCEENGGEVITDYQRLAEDVAVSGLQSQVTQARKNLGFKG